MTLQRDRFFSALGRIVSQVDQLEELTPFVQQLGRDHRKFGIIAEHFPPVGQSLIATLKYFSGPGWTPDLLARNLYPLPSGADTPGLRISHIAPVRRVDRGLPG